MSVVHSFLNVELLKVKKLVLVAGILISPLFKILEFVILQLDPVLKVSFVVLGIVIVVVVGVLIVIFAFCSVIISEQLFRIIVRRLACVSPLTRVHPAVCADTLLMIARFIIKTIKNICLFIFNSITQIFKNK
jgi:hypothetical protein